MFYDKYSLKTIIFSKHLKFLTIWKYFLCVCVSYFLAVSDTFFYYAAILRIAESWMCISWTYSNIAIQCYKKIFKCYPVNTSKLTYKLYKYITCFNSDKLIRYIKASKLICIVLHNCQTQCSTIKVYLCQDNWFLG